MEYIRLVDFLAKSLYLKPIEHVWKVVGRLIATRYPPSGPPPTENKSSFGGGVMENICLTATGYFKLPDFRYEFTL